MISRHISSSLPLGTLSVNIIGGFFIGFILEGSMKLWSLSPDMRIFLVTGILGGLTTFSAFSYETVELLSKGSYFLGMSNAALNLILSLASVWIGRLVVQGIG
ncbi:fluoride efflux transporter CrcB [Lutispora sp.]|nr:fluoride efflux transporter CrcB [Lutispora sp.]MEA4962547.1 fluoride efflux transporter CrcB [Lutispora sp.]